MVRVTSIWYMKLCNSKTEFVIPISKNKGYLLWKQYLELWPEVNIKYPHSDFGFPMSKNRRYDTDMIILELMLEVKVTMIKNGMRHYATLRCINTSNLEFIPQII